MALFNKGERKGAHDPAIAIAGPRPVKGSTARRAYWIRVGHSCNLLVNQGVGITLHVYLTTLKIVRDASLLSRERENWLGRGDGRARDLQPSAVDPRCSHGQLSSGFPALAPLATTVSSCCRRRLTLC